MGCNAGFRINKEVKMLNAQIEIIKSIADAQKQNQGEVMLGEKRDQMVIRLPQNINPLLLGE